MDFTIKNRIESCFGWHNDPANAYGAPALMEQEGYWDEIDLYDDDDLEALVDLSIRSMRMGDTPNTDFVAYLISKGFDINARLANKDCLLLRAVDNWLELPVIQQLIDLGADIYSETADGTNALLLAAKKNYDEVDRSGQLTGYAALAIHLAEHCDLSRLDKADKFGVTPLHYAVLENHLRLAQALIAHGSDVNGAGTPPIGNNSYWLKMDGVTPLALACRCGNVEIAKMLLDAGADETLRDAKGDAPIFSLLRYPFRFFDQSRYNHPIFDRKKEILALLKDTELTDAQGYTALMRSLCDSRDIFDKVSAYDNLPVTLALMERGADVNHTGNDGKRPLHLAVTAVGDVEKKLVKAGAELNVQDAAGDTPLHIACRWCGEKQVRYLLKAGADCSIRNNKGQSAMDIAVERGLSDALELMMEQ